MTDYPASLDRAMRDIDLLDDPGFQKQLEERRCAPMRLFEYVNRYLDANEDLRIYRGSEGHTKSWSDPMGCYGFVANK